VVSTGRLRGCCGELEPEHRAPREIEAAAHPP
jgi:hypothetical protein